MATLARPLIDAGLFFRRIALVEHTALVLDFDTTLRSQVNSQHPALPLPTVRELLDCIVMARRTRVIVASAGDAREVLAGFTPPYPEVWGRGGRERVTAVAAEAAAGTCGFIHPRQPIAKFSSLLAHLCIAGPVAYLKGVTRRTAAGKRLFVLPEFRLGEREVSLGEPEDIVQFLTDWLRACAGEIC